MCVNKQGQKKKRERETKCTFVAMSLESFSESFSWACATLATKALTVSHKTLQQIPQAVRTICMKTTTMRNNTYVQTFRTVFIKIKVRTNNTMNTQKLSKPSPSNEAYI